MAPKVNISGIIQISHIAHFAFFSLSSSFCLQKLKIVRRLIQNSRLFRRVLFIVLEADNLNAVLYAL